MTEPNLDLEDIRVGGTYVDRNGKRVRVTGIDKENVTWVNAEGVDTGTTNIENFSKNYCIEGSDLRAA
jgi:hypothetical protein